MAVYTHITDEQLLSFLGNYNIGALLSCKGIAEGVENSNYLLQTRDGSFILTLYEKRVNEADLPFFVSLMEHLSAKGVNCPRPVRQKNGEALATLAGRPAAIVSFLNGVSLSNPKDNHCKMLGEALCQMHIAGQDFSKTRTNALSVDSWRPLFQQAGEDIERIQPGLGGLIDDELDFLERNWPDHLPTGIIHADLFPDNVFFLDDKLSGFIDYYFSCNDMLVYDVAICINAWCFNNDQTFNASKSRHLTAGYQIYRKFTKDEIDALPILLRGSALRFLLTRVYDWLNTPELAVVTPKNPIEYINKIKFHQSITNFGIYGA